MRIVAGEFKGRTLEGPKGVGTRPTGEKVREALFSILGGAEGLRVLDLFAGTGALGLEALSRGAAEVVLVERDRRSAALAARNAEALVGKQSPRVRVVRGDALKFLGEGQESPWDLVLIDPPYAELQQQLARLGEALLPQLAAGARVVVESDRRSTDVGLHAELPLRSEHRYGDTLLRVFQA